MSIKSLSELEASDSKYSAYRDPEIWRRQQKVIAQGCLTNSKHPRSHIYGVTPTHVSHGHGGYLYGIDGKKYIDFICGLGANLFGYGNETILRAGYDADRGGYCHSFSTPHETVAAEKLCELFTFVDQWKFLKTGSEACSAAVRIARAATGRGLVLTDGYHGHHAEFTSLTPPASGCNGKFEIQPLSAFNGNYCDVAAVIIEPVVTKVDLEWLRALRDVTSKNGALLIFDEVITGFRYRRFSVSNDTGIYPDLFVVGKAMAGGRALSAVGGKRELMSGDYFISSTFSGAVGPLASCKAVCEMLQKADPYNLDTLWTYGQQWINEFNLIWPEAITLEAYPTRGLFKGDAGVINKFLQESCFAGMLFCRTWFYNFCHTTLNYETLGACRDILMRIKSGAVEMLGSPPQSPFAERVRSGSSKSK